MFGMRHFQSRCEERWAAGRGWRHRHGGHGWGGRHGIGGGDMMRAGRMLAQGDLRLIALALIAEQPRHGYEIIKLFEEKTGDWYSPSPGIVYPTLTYLEEAGHVTASAEESNKRRPLPPLVEAAFDHLRETVGKRLENDDTAEARLVEILARTDADLQRL